MKRVLLSLLLFTSISTFLFAENVRKVTSVHYYEGDPKREMTFYNSDGEEVAKEFYNIDGRVMGVKGDIPEGDIFEYYENGNIKSNARYNSNLLYNETEYYESGVKKSSIKNEWSGIKLQKTVNVMYYPDGNKQQEIEMDGDGSGISKLYYDTGELFETAELKDVCRDGKVTRYYKSGKKQLSGFMKDDMLNGLAEEYDIKGKLIRKVEYIDDKIR
ncbi:MAG: hypothetical protein FWD54_00310 [Endomicrobia bacterium]|nr:hypothetical protein [Endomicrobiia bacterium]MCL2798717.1 hypothetical protein [Endomicrobiia bacterium]